MDYTKNCSLKSDSNQIFTIMDYYCNKFISYSLNTNVINQQQYIINLAYSIDKSILNKTINQQIF